MNPLISASPCDQITFQSPDYEYLSWCSRSTVQQSFSRWLGLETSLFQKGIQPWQKDWRLSASSFLPFPPPLHEDTPTGSVHEAESFSPGTEPADTLILNLSASTAVWDQSLLFINYLVCHSFFFSSTARILPSIPRCFWTLCEERSKCWTQWDTESNFDSASYKEFGPVPPKSMSRIPLPCTSPLIQLYLFRYCFPMAVSLWKLFKVIHRPKPQTYGISVVMWLHFTTLVTYFKCVEFEFLEGMKI